MDQDCPDWDGAVKRYRALTERNTADLNDEAILRELHTGFTELLDKRYVLREDGTQWPNLPNTFGELVPFMYIQQDITSKKLERLGKPVKAVSEKRKASTEQETVKRPRTSSFIDRPATHSPLPASPPIPSSSPNMLDSLPRLVRLPDSASEESLSLSPPPISTNLTDLLLQQTANLRKLQNEYNESIRQIQAAQEAHTRISQLMAEAKQQINETARRLISDSINEGSIRSH